MHMVVGSGSDARIRNLPVNAEGLVPQLALDLSIKKARGQLLSRGYKWDFWVPGGKGRGKEGEGSFCYALEEEEWSNPVGLEESWSLWPPLLVNGQGCLTEARWD